MSCTCQNCGNLYSIDILVPNQIWEEIKPIEKPKGAGLLCGKCIIERISKLEQYGVWLLIKQGHHDVESYYD